MTGQAAIPGACDAESRRAVRAPMVAAVVLSIHAGLVAWLAAVNSPNLDELAHLPSGLSHWHLARFDLYRVNPPLVRMLATMPLLLANPETDWSERVSKTVYARLEFVFGQQFTRQNASSLFWYFRFARWVLIPFSVAGGWCCYRWASELYGAGAGILAVTLYGFCPNLMTWGASITPDGLAASTGLIASYAFWRWLRIPSWRAAIVAGACLGLAELAKTTWIVLFPLWPTLWCFWIVGHSRGTPSRWRPQMLQLTAALLLAIYLVNLGYLFEGSFKRLGDYRFISRALSGQDTPPDGANRFVGSWAAVIPVPFPENYIRGIDVQRRDFEQKKRSFLRGEQKKGGWWYYYLYGLIIKTPLGTLALAGLAIGSIFIRRKPPGPGPGRDHLVLLAPALVVFVLVSSQTGFSRHVRYVLPTVPFFYIFISGAVLVSIRRRFQRTVAAAAMAAMIVESAGTVPHSLSFFNLLVGGPLGGHAHLLDANIDWGQDLLFLKRWYDQHPEARPFHLAYFCGWDIDPRIAGIEWEPIPEFRVSEAHAPEDLGLPPGWYAVSVNYLRGYRYFETDGPRYTAFLRMQPAGYGGYSIYIYHIPPPGRIGSGE